MAEYGKLDKPTLNVGDFQKGDFAQWLLYDKKPSFAVVTDVRNDDVRVIHFEDGFGFGFSRTPKYGGIRKATKDEALAYFHSIADSFEKEIEDGGLSGALSARRQHSLNGVIANLEANRVDPYTAITTAVKDPETGLYVLMGIYSGQGPSEHIEGLVAVPRLSEEDVSKAMIKIKPNGFGNIPSDVYNTPATSHGSLVAMWSYEVPERARELVPNPKKLEDLGSEWRFSETFAKE